MKRNSKRFLALFLSVAMTVTPAALTQAESESTGVQVTVTPAEEAVVTEAPKEETAPAQEEKAETTAPEETTAPTETPEQTETAEVSVTEAPAQTEDAKEETAAQPAEDAAVTEAPAAEEASGNGIATYTMPEDLKEDGSNMTIDKADDTAYKMFKIASSSAELKGDKIKITLTSNGKNYNKIYLGHKEDAASVMDANAIAGTETETGYTFVFEIDAKAEAQTIYLVPHSVKNNAWYTTQDLKLTFQE